MLEYESSYQHIEIENSRSLSDILEVSLDSDAQERLESEILGKRVGLFQSLNLDTHISDFVLRTQQLLDITKIPQVVIYSGSYFILDVDGSFKGPLSSRCKPGAESAQAWADSALRYGNSELFSLSNALLPTRLDALSDINANIMRRAFEQAVEEFQSEFLTLGMIVGSYSPHDVINKKTHRAGRVMSLTKGGAMVNFSADETEPTVEVPRTFLFDPSRMFQISMEIEQREMPGRN